MTLTELLSDWDSQIQDVALTEVCRLVENFNQAHAHKIYKHSTTSVLVCGKPRQVLNHNESVTV